MGGGLGFLAMGRDDLVRDVSRDLVVVVQLQLEVAPMIHNATCFPRLKHGDVDALNARLRAHYDTAIVPGRFFGLADHFRLGVGNPTELVEAGLERLGRALDEIA